MISVTLRQLILNNYISLVTLFQTFHTIERKLLNMPLNKPHKNKIQIT